MLNTPETVYLVYAVNQIGAVSNMIGLNSPVQDMHDQMKAAESRLVITVEMAYETIAEAAKNTQVEKIVSVPIETSMPALLKGAFSLKQKHPHLQNNSVKWSDFLNCRVRTQPEPVAVSSTDTAVIVYTGGSTGTPKGCMISNRNAVAYHENYRHLRDLYRGKRKQRFLNILPPFIAFGLLGSLHNPLCLGTEVILYPDPSPEKLPELILKYKPNHLCVSRMHVDVMIKDPRIIAADLSCICSLVYGGEKESEQWEHDVIAFLEARGSRESLINGYGMTEISAGFMVYHPGTLSLYPYVHNNAMIIDSESGEELGYDREGELCVSSESLMIGYFKNPEATARSIFESNGQRWFRSGDLAVVHRDGSISITGRLKRVYGKIVDNKLGRVYPMRIEDVLNSSPLVHNCCVVGRRDPVTDWATVAFIILKDHSADTDAAKESLDVLCRSALPENHIPDEYVFTDSFPLTRGGKIDFRALEALAEKENEV